MVGLVRAVSGREVCVTTERAGARLVSAEGQTTQLASRSAKRTKWGRDRGHLVVGGGVPLGRAHRYRTHELKRLIHKIVNQRVICLSPVLANVRLGALFYGALLYGVDCWGSVGVFERSVAELTDGEWSHALRCSVPDLAALGFTVE